MLFCLEKTKPLSFLQQRYENLVAVLQSMIIKGTLYFVFSGKHIWTSVFKNVKTFFYASITHSLFHACMIVKLVDHFKVIKQIQKQF